MKTSYLWLFVLNVIQVITALCSFSTIWVNKVWLLRYDSSEDHMIKYSLPDRVEFVSSNNRGFSCINDATNDVFYYHLSKSTDDNTYYCYQTFTNNFVLLQKEINITIKNNVYDVSICYDYLKYVKEAHWIVDRWLIDKDINKRNIKTMTCPFQNGMYKSDHSQSSNNIECLDDNKSIVHITGDTIQFSLCGSGTFRSLRLKCLGYAPRDVFNEDEDNGDLLLLADPSSRPLKYYSVKYDIEEKVIKLSISTDGYSLKSKATDSFNTNSFKRIAMTLRDNNVTETSTCYDDKWTKTVWRQSYGDSKSLPGTMRYFTNSTSIIQRGDQIKEAWNCSSCYVIFPSRYCVETMNDVNICTQYVEISDDVILERSISTRVSSPSLCRHSMHSNKVFKVNFRNNQNITNKCPFSMGLYSVVLSNGDGGDQCRFVDTSEVAINEKYMDMRTCNRDNSYEHPLQSSLNCVASWISGIIDIPGSRNGDFALLSRWSPNNNRYEFYCARYTLESLDYRKMYRLSINAANQFETVCDLNKMSTSSSISNKDTTFLFRDKNSVQQNSFTCPCLNEGTCSVEKFQSVCICPIGVYGKICENFDSSNVYLDGSCRDAMCNSLQTQYCFNIEGGKHFCSCKLGFAGPSCENDIEECASNPCIADEVCIDGTNGYSCRCENPQGCGEASEMTKMREAKTNLIITSVGIAVLIGFAVLIIMLIRRYRNKIETPQKKASIKKADNMPNFVTQQNVSSVELGKISKAWTPDYTSHGGVKYTKKQIKEFGTVKIKKPASETIEDDNLDVQF